MKRLLTWTFPLLLACAAPACHVPFPKPGPKDVGGFFLVVAVKADEGRLAESVERTTEVFLRRCERLNLYCKAERHEGVGPNRIKLRVSGAKDAEQVKGVLLASGLELRAVVSPPSPMPLQTYPTREQAEAAARAAGAEALPYVETITDTPADGETFLVVERDVIAGGDDVHDARAIELHEDYYSVHFRFRPQAGARFGEWTRANINRYLAVILNGKVRTAPYIKSEITADGQIDGNFTRETAEQTALVLNTGNLPAPVEVLEEGTYKP